MNIEQARRLVREESRKLVRETEQARHVWRLAGRPPTGPEFHAYQKALQNEGALSPGELQDAYTAERETNDVRKD